jgi:2,3-dihydroxyphenylpropionate 1,2-dioxygenase
MGNIELRCWACAAGALGERKPDVISLDPSWHHNYATLAWIGAAEQSSAAHYPSIKPELVDLTAALHGIAQDPELRRLYAADASAYADRFRLTGEQRAALIELDVPRIVTMGVHPLVPFLAQLQIKQLVAR